MASMVLGGEAPPGSEMQMSRRDHPACFAFFGHELDAFSRKST